MTHVIVIPPDGAAKSVYSEKFSLGFLGTQRVKRAGEIVWDETEQSWSVYFVGGEGHKKLEGGDGFETYEEARVFEERIMTLSISENIPPWALNRDAIESIRRGHKKDPAAGADGVTTKGVKQT